jgi:hypothetical protein
MVILDHTSMKKKLNFQESYCDKPSTSKISDINLKIPKSNMEIDRRHARYICVHFMQFVQKAHI